MKTLTTLLLLTLLFLISCNQKSNNDNNRKLETDIVNREKLENGTAKTVSVDIQSIQKPDTTISDNKDCNYDNEVSSLGIGLIIVPSKFELFNDSLLTNKLSTWDMYSADKEKANICSKFFMPEYGIMQFVCLRKTDKAYKVLVNYSEIKYLPILKGYEFKTWEEYILQSFGVRRHTKETGGLSENLSLRTEPMEKAKSLNIPDEHEMFCPMEIEGDWVKVKYDCFYNEGNNPHEGEPCHQYIEKCKNPLMGWLRWRKDNRLLIDIFLMP